MKRLFYLVAALLVLGACGKKDNGLRVPENFDTMTNEQKMQVLMEEKKPDSLALYICKLAMGEVPGASIQLDQAQLYAVEHFPEEDLIPFMEEMKKYEYSLPLYKKVKFVKMAGMEDPDLYSYELGLSYVGTIRDDKKDRDRVKQELDDFKKACKTDREFYKRFMKGFKLALEEDRHRDLDDKIYIEFINYQDSI